MMKHTQLIKPLLILFIGLTLFACKNDDDGSNASSSDLIGTWQRSDASDQYDYRLTFQANNNGFRSVSEVNDEGQGIASSRTFNWTVSGATLTFDYGEEPEVTRFNFNADGHLFLTDLTELHFVRLEE